MKSMKLNLSKMQKVAGDEHSSTFKHPDGHHMVIAHHAVSALQRKQLEGIPVQKLAEGSVDGPVSDDNKSVFDELDRPQPQPTGVDSPSTPGMVPVDLQKMPTNDQVDQNFISNPPLPEEVQPQAESENRSPAAAPAQANQASQSPASNDALVGAYNQGQKAISEQQKIEEQKASGQAQVMSEDLNKRQNLEDEIQNTTKNFVDHQQKFMNDYQENHIDPKHYFQSMDTGQRVGTAISLFLGGFGSAFTGSNPALDFINKQIDRDIQAQQSKKDDQKTLLGANQALYHDQVIAQNQTRINLNDIYDHKMQMEAAKVGTAQAKQAADAAHAKFAIENHDLMQKSAARAVALNAVKNGAPDPAKLVPLLVPAEHQKEVFGQIEAAENTKKMSTDILKSFEDAAKENTVLKTGANPFGQIRTPGSVYSLHQAMQPTFKDLEGTVRQAAMDNTFKNITPMPGDSEHTLNQKRHALNGYLQSKMSAPTARAYGIDLSKYNSTAPNLHAGPSSMEGKTASNAKGERVIMQNGKWVKYNGQ